MKTRPRVLIAEDDPITRASLTGMLEGSGFAVTAVPDGGQAWDAFCAEPFDLVISDINMPNGRMDGNALLDTIKQRSSKAKVILMTGLTYPDDFDKISTFPPDSLLIKPFGKVEIERAIHHCLQPTSTGPAQPAPTNRRHSLKPVHLDPAQVAPDARMEILIELNNGNFETLCTDQEPLPLNKAICLQRLGFKLWTRK